MKYNDYLNTLIGYYDEIPKGWKIKRNKDLLRITKTEVGDNWNMYDLLSLTTGGVIKRDIESGKGKFPESFNSYQIVVVDDLIFCLYDIEETPRIVGISPYVGMITGSYRIMKCYDNILPKFIYYLYLTIDEVKGLRPFYTGLRNVIRPETFMNLKIIVPPLEKQKEIVEFLDDKEKRIQNSIQNQKRRIDLLEEYRKSLFEIVVTGQEIT